MATPSRRSEPRYREGTQTDLRRPYLVGKVHTFQGPNLSTAEVDVTALDNATGYKESDGR